MEPVVALLRLISFIVFADVILSWIQKPHQSPRRQLMQLLDPVYAPIRKVLNPEMTGGLDLSPMILIIGLNALARMLAGAAF